MIAQSAVLLLALAAAGINGLSAADVARQVGFDQRLGEQLPLQLVLHDAGGNAHALGDYFNKEPVALMFGYYHCQQLCSTALDSFAYSVAAAQLPPADYNFIFVSVDPRETSRDAAARQAFYMRSFPAAARWNLLTAGAGSIRTLTRAAGLRYAYDARLNQYAHPAGIIMVTPAGRIARYLQGVAIAPDALREGLAAAADGHIGTRTPPLLLLCYQYDPSTGRYSLAVMRLVQLGALATVLGLLVLIRKRRTAPC